MKKFIALMLSKGCLLAGVAWGGQFSVEMCAPAATVGARTAAKIATSSSDKTRGTLCKVDRDADFSTAMGVFAGSSASSLKGVASDDDNDEYGMNAVSVEVAAGTTSYIAVGGYEDDLVTVAFDAHGGKVASADVRA